MPRWRTGRWEHGDHLGRAGWWWVVDGEWYFYPAPIYPYPDPYVPPGTAVAAPPAPTPLQYWYYCPSAQAYYPYVSAFPEGWTPVVPPVSPPGSRACAPPRRARRGDQPPRWAATGGVAGSPRGSRLVEPVVTLVNGFHGAHRELVVDTYRARHAPATCGR